MRIALPSKSQYIKPERLRQSHLEAAIAVFRNPHLYELASELVPPSDPFKGGRPRQYPDWLILAFNALACVFGGARGAASELAADLGNGMTLWSILREFALEVGPKELTQDLPVAPPSREWFVRRRKLISADTHERMRLNFVDLAVKTAFEADLLDQTARGSRTKPSRSRMIYADGKVIDPITYAPSTKTRTKRWIDAETGTIVTEVVPVRFEPDAHEYETGDSPRVTGVKTWHCEVRGEFTHERVILMVDHVPGNKDEKNSENHIALKNLMYLAPLVPGALGVVLDGVLRGTDLNTLKRSTGWVIVSPVAAAHVDPKTGERSEREVHVEDVEFEYPDGRKATVELWAIRGQLHYKDWDEGGEAFFVPLKHNEVIVRGEAPVFRHYARISVPDPRGDGMKNVLVRSYTNEEDNARDLNRAEWVRDLPPLDPRYEIYGIREDSENFNNIIDTALPLRHARSYGAANIMFDLLAQAFVINSVTRGRVKRRAAQTKNSAA